MNKKIIKKHITFMAHVEFIKKYYRDRPHELVNNFESNELYDFIDQMSESESVEDLIYEVAIDSLQESYNKLRKHFPKGK